MSCWGGKEGFCVFAKQLRVLLKVGSINALCFMPYHVFFGNFYQLFSCFLCGTFVWYEHYTLLFIVLLINFISHK